MKKDIIWKALFTKTGSEIYEISRKLGRFPDEIITNKPLEKIEEINEKLLDCAFDRFVFIPRMPTIDEYKTSIRHANIVTLHGFLRIVPPEICYRYLMFNGHPGLITKFPELKGKDPQKRAWESNKYTIHGHVIHKVVPVVDAGDVVSERSFYSEDVGHMPLELYIQQLHTLSIDNWVDFLKKRL